MRDSRDTVPILVTELTDVLGWELPETGWARVNDALIELAGALSGRDRDRVATALDSLLFSGPIRLRTRLGDDPAVPAPEEVRERVNRLIRDLESGDDRDTQ